MSDRRHLLGKRALKAQFHRDNILEVAREVLAERGFALDMAEILRRANVGSGTVYRYFKNKESLVRAVIDEMLSRTRKDLTEIAATRGDAREDVQRAMQVGFTRVKEYGQLAIAIVAGTEPAKYRGIVDRIELEEFFGFLIRRGIAQGHFRPDLHVDYAVRVWFALVAPEALSRLLAERSVEEIAQATTDFFLAGLSHYS